MKETISNNLALADFIFISRLAKTDSFFSDKELLLSSANFINSVLSYSFVLKWK